MDFQHRCEISLSHEAAAQDAWMAMQAWFKKYKVLD
jgi:dienelactone hydrolase